MSIEIPRVIVNGIENSQHEDRAISNIMYSILLFAMLLPSLIHSHLSLVLI